MCMPAAPAAAALCCRADAAIAEARWVAQYPRPSGRQRRRRGQSAQRGEVYVSARNRNKTVRRTRWARVKRVNFGQGPLLARKGAFAHTRAGGPTPSIRRDVVPTPCPCSAPARPCPRVCEEGARPFPSQRCSQRCSQSNTGEALLGGGCSSVWVTLDSKTHSAERPEGCHAPACA